MVVAAADALGCGGALALRDIENGSAEKNSRRMKALNSDISRFQQSGYHRNFSGHLRNCQLCINLCIFLDQSSGIKRRKSRKADDVPKGRLSFLHNQLFCQLLGYSGCVCGLLGSTPIEKFFTFQVNNLPVRLDFVSGAISLQWLTGRFQKAKKVTAEFGRGTASTSNSTQNELRYWISIDCCVEEHLLRQTCLLAGWLANRRRTLRRRWSTWLARAGREGVGTKGAIF